MLRLLNPFSGLSLLDAAIVELLLDESPFVLTLSLVVLVSGCVVTAKGAIYLFVVVI